MSTPPPEHYFTTLYEVEERTKDNWWYRCKKCGEGAGGYEFEWLCRLMADRHVMAPHK